jgi:hypothetical protein
MKYNKDFVYDLQLFSSSEIPQCNSLNSTEIKE